MVFCLHLTAALPREYLHPAFETGRSPTPGTREIPCHLTRDNAINTTVDHIHRCNFTTIQDFFDHATAEDLDITEEVRHCQNLCPLTFGVGNPDLSGIRMMTAYTMQTGLTVLLGPVYRLCYLTLAPGNEFTMNLKDVQVVFFRCNGFFIASSAMAFLAHLSKDLPTFEIEEIQAMAFLQINSLLVTFFCMVVVQPLSRWAPRVFLYLVVFAVTIAALSDSQLSSDSRENWRLASDACAHTSRDYDVINPLPYPSWTMVIFAVAGTLMAGGVLTVVTYLWVVMIGLSVAGMVFGRTMMWRQRKHLRAVIGSQFKDDNWNFGQFAALFIWAPIPVELLFIVNDSAQEKFEKWHRWNEWVRERFTPRSIEQINEHTPLPQSRENNNTATPDRIEDDRELLLVAVPSQNTGQEDTATSSGRSAVLP
ncbi:hypothetical protein BJX68DRAFT_257761 [Aspergillus pseudodeflectus]|uniref:Transmembrane protein n=1 Tax=Aspergillus pseudodeflectus TaxID=176178 RepID=A0ABR4JU35_9EURO